jgi:hypothetical protein
MSAGKGYIHCFTEVPDPASGEPDYSLADSAAITAYALANPTNFKVGSQIVAVNGDLSSVIDMAGTTVALIPLVVVAP